MTVQSAVEISRSLFSRSQPVSQSSPGTAAVKTTGAHVSGVRRLSVPPFKKDMRASSNSMIQNELETLRAWKMVAGGGVVDPRLESLISPSAMATATKHRASSPDRV